MRLMLIGLNGRKQAGKDTVFARAATIADEEVERASFADLLYRSAAASLGVTEGFLQTFKTEPLARVQVVLPPPNQIIRSELSIREYLQRYGTESHRDVFGENFWVDALDLGHAGRIVMVTDVRFKNEARAIRRAGGVVVSVVGPDEIENTTDEHASEKPLPFELIDAWITNDVRNDGFRKLDSQVATLLELVREGAFA